MEFRVLGPLEVWSDGHRLEIGGPRYPDPLAFLRTALRGTPARSTELAALARLDARRRLAGADRLDIRLERTSAPVAAFGTPTIPEFLSARTGCRTFSPASFGADLAAVCLRNARSR